VFDAARRCNSDWIVWMDADTYVHAPFNYKAFQGFLPNRAFLSYLGRGKKWPECGFYGINLKHPTGYKFLNEFEHVYEHAEYGIFQMEEWHDSFVFEEVRKKIAKKHSSDLIHNISSGIDGEGHPVINSALGAYLDHMKGNRKFDGKSYSKDLQVTRTEPYWQ
jgi:CO dehydrogenase/acetyl-CoA synthase beta subunit